MCALCLLCGFLLRLVFGGSYVVAALPLTSLHLAPNAKLMNMLFCSRQSRRQECPPPPSKRQSSGSRIAGLCVRNLNVLSGVILVPERKIRQKKAHKMFEKAVDCGTTSLLTKKRLYLWRRTNNFFCPVNRPVVPGSTGPSPEHKVYV